MSRRKSAVAVALLLVTASGAAGAQTTHSHSHGSVKLTGATPVITMERTQCKGMCAEYKLSFYEDGSVVYEGKANASKAGLWRAAVSKETVDDLVTQFQRIDFFALQPSYGGGLSQNPVAVTSLRLNDRTKTVSHDEGSPFSPESLTALEDRVDAAVQSVNWVR
jgi:Domain of unknown function (DUF6438)